MIGGIDLYLLAGFGEVFSVLEAGVNDPVPLLPVSKLTKPNGLQMRIGIEDSFIMPKASTLEGPFIPLAPLSCLPAAGRKRGRGE